mmetsp:Transcript_37773/g.93533  ORF Transcript_37773/g.93533 Transcript_37773/m.93533 type:complete len:215 (-) Transcript_37773:341-985(-)
MSCPIAHDTTSDWSSLVLRQCRAMASCSVFTRRWCASLATTSPLALTPLTLPPLLVSSGGETRSSSCMVLLPGAAHTSSTLEPGHSAAGASTSTGNIDTASCRASSPASVPSRTTSKTSGCNLSRRLGTALALVDPIACQPCPSGIQARALTGGLGRRAARSRSRAASTPARGSVACRRNVMGRGVLNVASSSGNSESCIIFWIFKYWKKSCRP